MNPRITYMGIEDSDRELREAVAELRRKGGRGEPGKRKDRPEDQPMPMQGTGPWIQDLVLEDLAVYGDSAASRLLADEVERRKALGLARYGRLLQAHNGRDVLQDAMEEAVDLINYLRQALAEAAEARDEVLRSHLASAYHEALRAGMKLAWVRALRRLLDEH